jgi:transcriptional regulator with XRE-family HTH domain
MEHQTEFGRWLREARMASKRTIAELAEELGMSANYIRILETRPDRPSELLAVRIAELLGKDAEEVVFLARGWPERLQDVKERFPTVSKRYIV